uniref:Uncharacterized protein n=1 Tax=Glossina austeni TaxID=7395 RepID=A0A1A9VD74_GLOAU
MLLMEHLIHESRCLLSNGQHEAIDMARRPWQRYRVPLLLDIPLHVAMITHILIAWDRKRWLNDPVKCRFPAFVCCCASWLTGMIIALPYPIYTIYLEMGYHTIIGRRRIQLIKQIVRDSTTNKIVNKMKNAILENGHMDL